MAATAIPRIQAVAITNSLREKQLAAPLTSIKVATYCSPSSYERHGSLAAWFPLLHPHPAQVAEKQHGAPDLRAKRPQNLLQMVRRHRGLHSMQGKVSKAQDTGDLIVHIGNKGKTTIKER
eukprot:scaffold342616_cov16-Prasinocladus_malaysianus.AAC.1